VTALVVLVALAANSANPQLAIGLDEHVGARVPLDLELQASTGANVRLGDLFDGHRPIVLVLAYARCTMLCSVVLHGIADAVRTSPARVDRDYVPVVVSLDSSETPDEAARRQNTLLADIHASDRAAWPYLVGDEAAIRALADALGFRYAWDAKTQQYAHPAVVFVLTPDGRIAEYLRGVAFDQLAPAVARAARGELTPSAARDLLACFHFDPTVRRYERNIRILFAAGGAAVLAALGALIAALVAWERRGRRRRHRP
jgi:protein SCO1/2